MTQNIGDLGTRRVPPPTPPEEIEPEILRLTQRGNELPESDRQRFERTYRMSNATGRLLPLEATHEGIRGFFGSVEAVSTQGIVRVIKSRGRQSLGRCLHVLALQLLFRGVAPSAGQWTMMVSSMLASAFWIEIR